MTETHKEKLNATCMKLQDKFPNDPWNECHDPAHDIVREVIKCKFTPKEEGAVAVDIPLRFCEDDAKLKMIDTEFQSMYDEKTNMWEYLQNADIDLEKEKSFEHPDGKQCRIVRGKPYCQGQLVIEHPDP